MLNKAKGIIKRRKEEEKIVVKQSEGWTENERGKEINQRSKRKSEG